VLLTLLLLGAIGGGIAFASWVVDVVNDTPDIEQLRAKPAGSISTVYASDGSRLGFISSDVLRTPVSPREIPLVMKHATVAIEDKRFYKHRGVDYTGVVRAAIKNVTSDGTSQGGSTLTMQLVRNLYIPENRFKKTWTRKIREAKLADELEKEHSKEWILVSYLNNVPFGTVGGQTGVGVQAAARIFFDKPARDLTLPEAALLAGLPQAPSEYNPFLNPEGARRRRHDVLTSMVDARYITQAQAAEADAAPLGVRSNNFYAQRREPFVFDYVKDELIRRYGADVVRQGGLKVYTSIDLHLQQAARDAIERTLYLPEDPASAVVTIDPSNGHILTMASSAEYGGGDDGRTSYNYAAQARRQPGSTFKVMVLMAALRKGIDPDSTYYTSKPLSAGWLPGYPTYEVATFGHTYSGSESITRATLQSDNTVFAQLAADVGPEAVRQAAYDLGVTSRLDAYPAEALGGLTNGVSPLEMASAYATIANGGIRMTPTAILKVKFPNGDVKDLGRVRRKRTFSLAETAEARRVLEANATGGTGTNANIGCPMGGKTGTTSDIKDAWFVGFTPRLSTAVWIGYVTPAPLYIHGASAQGGTFPSFIWNDYMTVAHGDYCGADWPADPGFQGSAFFGRYASTGSDDDDDYSYDGSGSDDGAATDDTGDDTGDATTGSTGGGDYNADEYARPPQEAPETQAPPNTGAEGGGAGAPDG
jgi:penicillin-binding protein 1A